MRASHDRATSGPLSLGGEGWGEGEPFERRSAENRKESVVRHHAADRVPASGELPPHPDPLPRGRGDQRRVPIAAGILISVVLATAARADVRPSADVDASIDKALTFLARQQQKDGAIAD